MVFQNYALYPHLSVYDNMAYGLKIQKIKKDEIRRRVEKIAGVIGLEELLERKPPSCPAASASGSPWAGRSCASRRCS